MASTESSPASFKHCSFISSLSLWSPSWKSWSTGGSSGGGGGRGSSDKSSWVNSGGDASGTPGGGDGGSSGGVGGGIIDGGDSKSSGGGEGGYLNGCDCGHSGGISVGGGGRYSSRRADGCSGTWNDCFSCVGGLWSCGESRGGWPTSWVGGFGRSCFFQVQRERKFWTDMLVSVRAYEYAFMFVFKELK